MGLNLLPHITWAGWKRRRAPFESFSLHCPWEWLCQRFQENFRNQRDWERNLRHDLASLWGGRGLTLGIPMSVWKEEPGKAWDRWGDRLASKAWVSMSLQPEWRQRVWDKAFLPHCTNLPLNQFLLGVLWDRDTRKWLPACLTVNAIPPGDLFKHRSYPAVPRTTRPA